MHKNPVYETCNFFIIKRTKQDTVKISAVIDRPSIVIAKSNSLTLISGKEFCLPGVVMRDFKFAFFIQKMNQLKSFKPHMWNNKTIRHCKYLKRTFSLKQGF